MAQAVQSIAEDTRRPLGQRLAGEMFVLTGVQFEQGQPILRAQTLGEPPGEPG